MKTEKNRKNLIFVAVFATLTLGILPSYSEVNGGISKSHFYDAEKTIMTDVTPSTTIKTEKYWGKNLFYTNKYRPLFMLSNKELFDLMPRENTSIVQRITTPSIYNISLKTNSIKRVSLAMPTKKKGLLKTAMAISKPIPNSIDSKNRLESQSTPGIKLISAYEQAKNPEVEPEKKVDAAILLKNSNTVSNYALAIDLLDDVTRKEPYNAYAFYLKGELYSKQNDTQNAIKNYVEALKINPASEQCCIGIAKILEPTNKELAQKYYDRAK